MEFKTEMESEFKSKGKHECASPIGGRDTKITEHLYDISKWGTDRHASL